VRIEVVDGMTSTRVFDTRSTPKGVLVNTYRPVGPLPQRSFHPESPSDAELARQKKLAAEDSGV
jgi:hypothetical protein